MEAAINSSPAGWKSAAVREALWHPLRFLRWTGRVKYQPVPYTDFSPVPFAGQEPFAGPKPRAIDPAWPWTASRAADLVMGHQLTVKHGLATCLGHVFNRRGQLIDGATHKYDPDGRYIRWKSKNTRIRSRSGFPRVHYYRETIGVLTASTQDFYFHWLMDVLPRLKMLEQVGSKVDYYYLAPVLPFQRETLSLLGAPQQRFISTADIEVITASQLVVPCHQVMTGRAFPAWVIEFLRGKFLPVSAGSAPAGNRRIYISRRAARHRRVDNEDEIIEKLRPYGFTEVKLEQLSFRQQVDIFQRAEVVVAPHGSGLTNLVFSSPGTTVIELFPAANLDLYYRLSHAARLNYFFLKSRRGDPHSLSTASYAVNWDDLKKTLAEAGLASSSVA